jgi:hypothetical protein
MFHRWRVLAVSCLLLLPLLFVLRERLMPHDLADADDQRVPLAVLGDSDSHAFHDSIWFPPGGSERGGRDHSVTFQWTEVLARLRDGEVNQGRWGVYGSHPRVARVASWVGLPLRAPRKQDYAFNFATSGATCEHLLAPRGQLAQLLRLLESAPEYWGKGAVVLRIGINDIGTGPVLRDIAANGFRESARARVTVCTSAIETAVRAIRQTNATVRIVLVGIADNANWPPNFDDFRSAEAMRNLGLHHDAYDDALRRLAKEVRHTCIHDDRAWFRERWGGRDAQGGPAYRAVEVGGLSVGMTQGDGLEHAILGDGHAGTVLNTLWARELVALLGSCAGLPLTPITTTEVDAFVRGLRLGAPKRG